MGATTSDEYSTHFEKDRALMRRSSRVEVESIDVETTTEIVKGLQPILELTSIKLTC